MQQPVLRVAFVRGVTPAKWARVWAQRRRDLPLELLPTDAAGQLSALRDGSARLAFVRLPVDDTGLHLIGLYEERPVAVVGKDHVLAAAATVTRAEIDALADGPVSVYDEHIDGRLEDALALVASGVGALVLPHSIARLHARRDLVARDVSDGEPTRIALVWPATDADGNADADDIGPDGLDRLAAAAAIDEFVGVVRGRTANSSRGGTAGQVGVTAPGSRRARAAEDRSGRRGGTSSRGRRHPKRRRP